MDSPEDILLTGSDSDLGHQRFYCQPCKTDGTVVTAVGHCNNCKEYLCQRCYDVHLVPSVTRKHVLVLTEHSRDSEKLETSTNPVRCEQHTGKTIKYHCISHSFLGCHTCFFENHRTCADVKFIPTVAKGITSTEEYRKFNATLSEVAANCGDLVARMEAYKKDIEISQHETIRAFQAHKKEVLDAIDNLKIQFIEKVENFKREEFLNINAVKDKVQALLSENQGMVSATEFLQAQQQDCDLYRTMVQTKERLKSLKTEILDAQSRIRERTLVFNANMDVLNTLKQPFGLGSVKDTTTRRIQNLKHVSDLNVKCTGDTSLCRITGSALVAPDKLVLTDINNKKVKLWNPCRNKVVSDLKFNSYPWGVCKVDDNKVAVALYEKKVVLVAVRPSLSVVREIPVNGICLGMGYCDGKLVVSYDSPLKLEIMDMEGSVLTFVQNDTNGEPLFKSPYQLCVNSNTKLIYVSNYDKNELLCLKFDGTVVCRYTDGELAGPWQAVVDSTGTVYVCGRGSKNVHQVTEDCQKVRVLLSAPDGFINPESISYDESEGRFYIGHFNNDFVKVYNVTSEQI